MLLLVQISRWVPLKTEVPRHGMIFTKNHQPIPVPKGGLPFSQTMFCRFNLHFWGEISVDKSSYRFNLHIWWGEISIVSRKKESVRSSHEVSIFGYFRTRSMIFPWNLSSPHFFEISMVCFLQKISPGHRRRRSPIRPRSRPCWSHGWSLMTKKPMKKRRSFHRFF